MIAEERKELNRQRIIDASTKLFIRQGITATTLAQIAKESNVVCRTVSNIFGNKSNLVLEDMCHISQGIMEHINDVISESEYKALTGLEQILCISRIRGEILTERPDILLLVSEVKVWVARSNHDEKTVRLYMDNLECLYRITKNALDKGMQDGSINPAVNPSQALSMIVPSFRAVIQQLAQVKMNPIFCKVVDVKEQLQIQLSVLRAGLEDHTKHNSEEQAGGQTK